MKDTWIVFVNMVTGKELARIFTEGYVQGEIKSTKELLSLSHGIKYADIGVVTE